MQEEGKVLDGVGQDAEIVTNEQGGKQSKSPMAMHLVDPQFLLDWVTYLKEVYHDDGDETWDCYLSIECIAKFMQTGDKEELFFGINVFGDGNIEPLVRIAKVLQYGADRYEPNNWRLIPQESHINHALIHLVAHLSGDTQDDHLDHALCRLMMAMATSTSPNFSYTDYVLPKGEEIESKLEL